MFISLQLIAPCSESAGIKTDLMSALRLLSARHLTDTAFVTHARDTRRNNTVSLYDETSFYDVNMYAYLYR